MNPEDKRLGMHRRISRRDFLNGAGIALGTTLLPLQLLHGAAGADAYYPPAASGMRGAHPGSFEVAHATVQGQRWRAANTFENYDLVVVGAGISGLAAAYIYRRDVKPDARILLLDNHDDFGGHAKRNEFCIGGRTLIGFGGTQYIEAPNHYPAVAADLLRELGIDASRFSDYHHGSLYPSLGLQEACFLDRDSFGSDHLALGSYGYSDALRESPLAASTVTELKRLFEDKQDYLAGMSQAQRRQVVQSISWREYLRKYAGLGEEALRFMQKWTEGEWAIGADAFPAWLAWEGGYPGFGGAAFEVAEGVPTGDGGGIFHFPDGNASVARLLVRNMIPEVAPGNSMEDIVTARFDYSQLDRPGSDTRIRLSSTVVDLRHRGGDLNAEVDISYVSGNEAHSVSAAQVIWAGYNAMLPHICPDTPAAQKAAQGQSVRAPLVYTNVLLRNWKSFEKLGLARAYCPGSFFQSVRLSRPVSMGGYQFPQSPDEPMVLNLQHIPLAPGLPAAEQFRAGRQTLLTTSFDSFERAIREQLDRMLAPGGFDAARDIAGITVNRWSHGYAFTTDAASGEVSWYPEYWQHANRPWEAARQPLGNITFAGTDASSNGMTESAIEEAHRAVHALGPGAAS
ncbi:twin-arginine translocation pathway signal [Luminiphilus syltensis NOR5-1B]|uniref:Twin-arginine translocation pathway signal n=1 Tax=Luminiphilus syltensis NOR5-1B TaxID=565045 RepID=B8KVL8_9GAMM|nr:FAD/NAD(P)-binding protein [Luminiphilus syltensis]EED35622.1 twin-arginine translocation pathway signal [Luminiphilus syltensis NOR5-1B]